VATRADHAVARGGWNKAVKTLTSSWEDGEDPCGVRQSCGGTKVYRFGLEKTRAENHCRTEIDATAGSGTRPEGAD
jgi:hypothetical protein